MPTGNLSLHSVLHVFSLKRDKENTGFWVMAKEGFA